MAALTGLTVYIFVLYDMSQFSYYTYIYIYMTKWLPEKSHVSRSLYIFDRSPDALIILLN